MNDYISTQIIIDIILPLVYKLAQWQRSEKEIEKEIFNLSSSESEEREENIVEPDQEPTKPPDLEFIRNQRSQSRARSTRSKLVQLV